MPRYWIRASYLKKDAKGALEGVISAIAHDALCAGAKGFEKDEEEAAEKLKAAKGFEKDEEEAAEKLKAAKCKKKNINLLE